MVADHAMGEGGEDRREGDRACPLHRHPDGRSGSAARSVPRPAGTNRPPPATASLAVLTATG